uniref:Uncharacterized protein n=1 Tax=Roya anglica TaxID=43943 RepID=A0A024B4S3_9VIRI|nr:hypothetical protein [Roya anglica]AHZ11083.1 hypothetical protein [Roya anglica]
MSLKLSYVSLNNVIIKCLFLETFEYSYIIPSLAYTAEYLGDPKIASICKSMSRQVKKNLYYAFRVHFYLSGHRIIDDLLGESEISLLNKIEIVNNIHDLKTYETFLSKNLNILKDIKNTVKYIDQNYISIKNIYNIEEENLFKPLKKIDKKLIEIFIKMGVEQSKLNLTSKSGCSFSNHLFLDNNNLVNLFRNLRDRHNWKAKKFYPLVAKIAYNKQYFQLSRRCLQIMKDEELLNILLTQKIEM